MRDHFFSKKGDQVSLIFCSPNPGIIKPLPTLGGNVSYLSDGPKSLLFLVLFQMHVEQSEYPQMLTY